MPAMIVAVLLLLARTAVAGVVLDVDASAVPGADGTTLRLTVRNTGDAAASDVRPAVHHQGVTRDGEPLPALASGAAHAWTIALERPAEPGAVPAIIDVSYTDDGGTPHTVPHVVAVETPGLPAADVTLGFDATPIGRYGRATLTLENRGAVPIHGRVVVALPSELITEPVSQAADVAAGDRIVLPIVVQPQGMIRAGVAPAFAFFDYGLDGRRHVVIGRTDLTVTSPHGPVSPLVVGSAALAAAFAALGIAWRIAARRRAAAT